MRIDTKIGILAVKFFKSAEEPVPYAEYIAVVAIGVWQLVVMMYMMQVGCNKDQSYNSIQPAGKRNSVWAMILAKV